MNDGGTCAGGSWGEILDAACVDGKNKETYTGASMGFDSRPLSIDCSKVPVGSGNTVHVNDSLWAFTSTSGQTNGTVANVLEIGLWAGYSLWDPTCNNTPVVYYWNYDSSGHPTAQLFEALSSDGSNHTLDIERDAGNPQYWNEYLDGILMYQAQGQNSDQIYQHMEGLEIGIPSGSSSQDISWAHASTFHNFATSKDMSGDWNDWTYYNTLRNHRCGLYPGGQCTNGSAPWLGEWDVNRDGS